MFVSRRCVKEVEEIVKKTYRRDASGGGNAGLSGMESVKLIDHF